MKNQLLFIVLIITFLAACKQTPKEDATTENTAQPTPTPTGQDTLIGPKGTIPTKFYVDMDITVYQYPDFKVLVETVEIEDGSIGESVKIVRNEKDTTEISRAGFNFFNGIAGNYLFIDEGTYDLGRTMYIYDITTNKKVGEFLFDSEEINIEGDQISYYTLLEENVAKALKPKPDCLEEKEIKANGLGLGYMEKYMLDLKTGKVTSTKTYKCRALS